LLYVYIKIKIKETEVNGIFRCGIFGDL